MNQKTSKKDFFLNNLLMLKQVSYFVFLILGFFILSGCGTKPVVPLGTSISYETNIVKTGIVIENKEYVGYTNPSQKTTISSEVGGRITNVLFDVGDKLSCWQELAVIDTNETDVQYSSAQDAVRSLNDLYNSTSKLFDSQIKAAMSKVKQAKIAMEMAKVGNGDGTTDKELRQLELQIETFKIELEKTKAVLDTQEQQLYKNAVNSLSTMKIGLTSIGNFIDQLMGISKSKRIYDDRYEIYLSAKNTSLKNKVKTTWYKLNNEYNGLVKDINYIKNKELTKLSDEDKEYIYNTLLKSEKFLKEVRIFLKDAYNMVDASVSSQTLSQSQIESWKQTISQMQQSVESMLLTAQGNFMLGIQGSIQAIDSFKNQDSMKLTLLQKKIDIAKQQYETMKDKSGKGYEIAKQQYQEALSSIEVLKAQKKAQLSQIKTQIANAQGQKNTALVYLQNATIKSPFDSIVLQKHVEVGQFVGPGTPIATIGSDDLYELSFSVPVQYSKLYKPGFKVTFFVPDLGKTYTGVITTISPITDMMTKKIAIKASFVVGNKDKLPFGTYTKVYIPLKKHIGYVIPIQFVQYNYGKSFVYVLGKVKEEGNLSGFVKNTGMKFNKQEIDVDYCNNKVCVIKFGLKKGDIIVKKSK